MKAGSTMGGCLFGDQEETCTMDVGTLIATWQQFGTVQPRTQSDGFFAVVALLLVVFVVVQKFATYQPETFQLYERQRFRIPFVTQLAEAFSNGILNSKIYA